MTLLLESLQDCCDLSQLWYREFYLEMTMGRKIQVIKTALTAFRIIYYKKRVAFTQKISSLCLFGF